MLGDKRNGILIVTLYSSRITEYVFSSDAFWPLGCAFWLYRVAGLFRKVRHIWKSKPKIAYLIWFVPWAVVVLVSGQLPVVGAEKANRIFLAKIAMVRLSSHS